MNRKFNIGVVGATGAVGEAIFDILQQRNFPVDKVYALASSRSAGKKINFNDQEIIVKDLEAFDFTGVEIALFSAGKSISQKHVLRATEAGCIVIDNTSCFRYEEDVPLVVPEVNAHAITEYRQRGIIANPNCSTIQLVVALKPIYDAVGIERINVCTYQAVSGAGKKAIDELAQQTIDLLNSKTIFPSVHSRQIAFNVLPQIDTFQDNGYTREEMKMVWETRKILAQDSIQINPTAVRVPVFYGHSEAVHIETKEKLTAESAKKLLSEAPGVVVVDEPMNEIYPTAVTDAAGSDEVYVGRIREDISHPRGINLWVISDNVRKGAALNSIQIAEILVKDYL